MLDEVAALFPSRIIHIGGDEAGFAHWQNSDEVTAFMKEHDLPTCSDMQLWAINRMSAYLASKGIRMIGWNEITGDNIRNEAHVEASRSERLAEGVIVQFWDGDITLVNKAIDKGYDVVNSRTVSIPISTIPTRPSRWTRPTFIRSAPRGAERRGRKPHTRLGVPDGRAHAHARGIWFQTLPRCLAAMPVRVDAASSKEYDDFRRRVAPLQELWRAKGIYRLAARVLILPGKQESPGLQGRGFVLSFVRRAVSSCGRRARGGATACR